LPRSLHVSFSWFVGIALIPLTAVGIPFLAWAMKLAQAPPTSVSAQAIHVSVNRVNVGAVVTDSRGNFVDGLNRENFLIFDDGVQQPLTDFAAIDAPAQVLLLIEAGPAVYLLENNHLRAARALLDGLSAGDRLAVVSYAQSPQPLLDFTPDKELAAAALDRLRFNLGFGDLNLSSSLSAVLDWLPQGQGKKSLVLLSTGVDSSPEEVATATLNRLKIGDVRLLAVSLSGPLRNPKPGGKMKVPSDKVDWASKELAESDRFLSLVAVASGGRAYFPTNAKEFSAAYAEIAQLVRHEYSLAFAPAALNGKIHTIEVRVTTASTGSSASHGSPYRVDYRRAYLAPKP